MSQRVIIISIFLLLFSIVFISCSETVVEPEKPQLIVSEIQHEYYAPFRGPSPNQSVFYITSSSDEVLNYSFSNNESWLELFNSNSASFGLTPDSVFIIMRVSSPALLVPGTYYDTIEVTTDSVSQATIYREVILHIGSEVTSAPKQFEFYANVNGENPEIKTLQISSTTSIDLDVAIANSEPWLSVSRTTFNTSENDTLTVSLTTGSLTAGTYVDTIYLSSDSALNSPYKIPVTFDVKPWVSQISPWGNNINDVTFADTMKGWAVGDIIDNNGRSGFVIRTIDGGKHWESIRTLFTDIPFDSILAGITFQGSEGWIVGTDGIIMHSFNDGLDWTFQTKPTDDFLDFNDVFFISPDSGWIVGDSGIVLATSDGGDTWDIQSVPRNETNDSLRQSFTGISFVDNIHGWVSGLTNVILITSDGGQTWTQQTVPDDPGVGSNYDFKEIDFTDLQHGWAVGKQGLVISTTNGGTTWTTKQVAQASGLLSLSFISATTGWISDQVGGVFQTTDGGATWNAQTIESTSSLQSIFFLDEENGWVVGGDGTIFHSTSGGN